MAAIKHLFFDNDGTLVDTEQIAQKAMLEVLANHGFLMSEAEYSHQFPGLLLRDILQILELKHGFKAPAGFVKIVREAHENAYKKNLRAIPGMPKLFRSTTVPKSMVSNGSVEHVEKCLKKIRLLSSVTGQIFSAEQVSQPKPFPDVYQFALKKTGIHAQEALVIEDSTVGVLAAKAAGIRVVGFLGASHLQEGHTEKLIQAGADFIAKDARDLAGLFETLAIR
jgi:beta-phosphoglucomutase-like phosphatase (HAD superfamily)